MKTPEFFAGGYVIHESHKPVDIADVSLVHDFVCEYCKKVDKELIEPCEFNPSWQVAI